MGNLMVASVELHFLFYHCTKCTMCDHLSLFVPLTYAVQTRGALLLKALQDVHQNTSWGFPPYFFNRQTFTKKKRHILMKQNSAMTACKSLIQPDNRQK